jgi:putative endonuclease
MRSQAVMPECCNLASIKGTLMADRTYYVYILACRKNGTLYIGVTSDLARRVYEHKEKMIEGFTKKYGVDKLVYFEQTQDVQSALEWEKQLKKWNRQWKVELIEKSNPDWLDLYGKIL